MPYSRARRVPASVRASSTAAPTAYSGSPTRRATMPAHSDASVSSLSARSSGRADLGPADDDGDGGVPVPAGDLGPAVDREQVALLEDARTGDPVHDLLVDRGAQGVPVARDELEVRDAAVVADERLGEGVELERRHPRAHGAGHQLEGAPHEQAGRAHRRELLRCLALAPVTREESHAAAPYPWPPATPHSRHDPSSEQDTPSGSWAKATALSTRSTGTERACARSRTRRRALHSTGGAAGGQPRAAVTRSVTASTAPSPSTSTSSPRSR